MNGFVLKSHVWPTVGRAYHLRKRFPEIDIFSSITLNSTAGGLNPMAVESAAKQGAKVVFMPTWSAANDLRRGGFCKYMQSYLKCFELLRPEDGITILDSNGRLRPEVKKIVQIAKEYELVIATSHISPEESLALAEGANQVDLWPVIFSHPDSHSVGGTIDDIRKMVERGAFVEFCAVGMMPAFQRIHPRQVVETVREVGAEHCILSTDFFFDWSPPPPEMLRMAIATLLTMGLSEEETRFLVQINPARILRIESA
jgi:microsomal dipeptidase-like Zn-dependent dipeptidase